MLNKENLQKEFDNLDEPIWDTIKRDLISILVKIRYVLLPFSYEEKIKYLRDWDLFGPLLISLSYAMLLITKTNDVGQFFTSIFLILIFGALIVTFNVRLMGGEGSVFLFLSILGYCLTPFLLASVIKVTLGYVSGLFVF